MYTPPEGRRARSTVQLRCTLRTEHHYTDPLYACRIAECASPIALRPWCTVMPSTARRARSSSRHGAWLGLGLGLGSGVGVGVGSGRLQGQTKRRPVEIGDFEGGYSSSTRGSGWYVAGIPVAVPRPGGAELPRDARSALKRPWECRAGALPVGHFDHVAAPTSCR
eukprot:scaffold30000_cov59-Phaeocystis_antarctica.AAC.3